MSVRCSECGAVAGYGYELGHKSDCSSHLKIKQGKHDQPLWCPSCGVTSSAGSTGQLHLADCPKLRPPVDQGVEDRIDRAVGILPGVGNGYAVAVHGKIDVATIAEIPRAAVVNYLHRAGGDRLVNSRMTDAEVWLAWTGHSKPVNRGLELVRVHIVNMGKA